ncbi:hypothetical protein [Sphingomonas hylomeconis]|uniref:Uncharacterized protein n=1 Tax=Sphingomonas hylomeconis TaxID=1395958 RepID=A0ABV7SX67_9SPHN|nr:hypothetical protein [Sphingomonas hylomeconis]
MTRASSIHAMRCPCAACRPCLPTPRSLLAWPLAIAVAAGGAAGILLDLSGCTPAIGAALGVL